MEHICDFILFRNLNEVLEKTTTNLGQHSPSPLSVRNGCCETLVTSHRRKQRQLELKVLRGACYVSYRRYRNAINVWHMSRSRREFFEEWGAFVWGQSSSNLL